MSAKYVCPIQALGKKLKRRTLKRADWLAVRQQIRSYAHGRKTTLHPEAAQRMVLVIDRHAPTLLDSDPLALRAAFLDRFPAHNSDGPWRRRAARHMIRRANGLPGISHTYQAVGPAYGIRGYFKQLPIAKLPADRSAA